MQIALEFGRDQFEVTAREKEVVGVHRQVPVPPLADPVTAVRQALETPVEFPALRLALTPDDHVSIVVDEHLPRLGELLAPVIDHVVQAGVAAEAITLVCPPSSTQRAWLNDLPAIYREIPVEVHDPSDRRHLSYLATTRHGRRIYLNRKVVDADQLVVLSRRGYDPLLGYSGSEGAIFPDLSDEATRNELCGRLSLAAPGQKPWPIRQEATEVAWLLGAPFMVQVIDGAGETYSHVVGGPAASGQEGQRLLDARWRISVAEPADLVVATVGGNPEWHDFAALAQALASAARVTKAGGRIVLLTQAKPALETGAEIIRQAEDPAEALKLLRQQILPDLAAAFQWASTVQQHSVYLLSNLPGEMAEELFTIPLEHPDQVQRLLDQPGSTIFIPDAHKTMAGILRSHDLG